MVIIQVIKAFVLNLGGQLRKFEIGVHEVEQDIADHWFVKAHTADEPQAALDTNTEEQSEGQAEGDAGGDATNQDAPQPDVKPKRKGK